MTIGALLRRCTEILKSAGVPDPEYDARELLLYAGGFSRAEYILKSGDEAGEPLTSACCKLIDRRALREPLQYIVGSAPFFGRDFVVRPGVLIPRFDTETLVEAVLPHAGRGKRILDLCTGSGCILISILLECGGDAEGTGSDLSDTALRTAEENAERLGAKARFVKSDLFEEIEGRYDIITANPPYIRTDVIASLDREVRDFEPHEALDGTADGLEFYRRIIDESPRYLNDGGLLGLEIGYDQGDAVTALMDERGFREIRLLEDLGGNPRAVMGFASGNPL